MFLNKSLMLDCLKLYSSRLSHLCFQQFFTLTAGLILCVGQVQADTVEIPDSTPDRFPAQLFLENDFFRAVSEIYRLKFEYGNTLKPDLEILLLHSQYRLHEYHKVMQNSKKLLDREEIQSVATQRFEIGKLLTASLIQTGRPDEAGQVWQYHCYPVTGEEFLTADNLPDRIDPEKARLYSAVLPGSGFLLSGEYNKAIVSFLLNALFIAGIYQYAADNQYGIAGVLVFFELGWYFGGQNASYEAAEKVNFKKIQQAQQDWIEKKLN